MTAPPIRRVLSELRRQLLAEIGPRGHWVGRLSSSALSTATACFALSRVDERLHATRIARGLDWLIAHQNPDGGWGDTTRSDSNISTTLLCRCALPLAGDRAADAVTEAEGWLAAAAGSTRSADLAAAVERRYGADRTFSVPILTMAVLAGQLGPPDAAWRRVAQLPFELAALPQSTLRLLRLPVVSYALPALVAMGQARHHFRPTRLPVLRLLRNRLRSRTLRVLDAIQPASGGFLEAAPLTSFVLMCLAATGQAGGRVGRRCAKFLADTQRDDGSWPIDTNLATWVTTLAINAGAADELDESARTRLRDWLLGQQYRRRHPYTGAAPGGWAWTDLSGGVPDADDTAGALLALRRLGPPDERTGDAAAAGAAWLLDLQNRDGGVPTFCRGWGRLPFDRSAADLTAHALLAWRAWRDELPALRKRIDGAMARAGNFLARRQRADGSWLPLWFGNQREPDDANAVYGTARVLIALTDLDDDASRAMRDRGAGFLLAAQQADGGWGGGPGGSASSVEETALATDALSRLAAAAEQGGRDSSTVRQAALRGAAWLCERAGAGRPATPVGLYFAKLWYFERLYPLTFAAGALASAERLG